MLFSVPETAKSQSNLGCRDLLGGRFPAIEGTGGMFFRVEPDMLMYNRLSDEMVDQIGDLAKALSANGTTLVLLPMPTKALVMSERLGPDAAQFGYDPSLAATIYADTLARLDAAGVTLIDVRAVLRNANAQSQPYFDADSRLNNAGLLALARAFAEGVVGADTSGIATETVGTTELASVERLSLQSQCLMSLPEVSSPDVRLDTAEVPDGSTASRIMLANTDLTGQSDLNFVHYLAGLSGLPVAQHSVTDSGVAAAASALTSDTFWDLRPEYLIWELPLWQNPGRHGDQPLRELIAAAKGQCGQELVAERTDTGKLRVDLPQLDRPKVHSLLLQLGDQATRRADFGFTSAQGQVRSRSILRPEDQQPTTRFLMPMTGLWPDGAETVEVTSDAIADGDAKVFLCEG
ncbi:alginate O-acetyltransferase AlgX-related protein [Aliiroseovarius sp. YM-037]|uniref:alginate O-acetyltransferase AlgX-related protein n=1 Tax=Aliiroseovarius sp. YM-037 TaxID=3341728 RepID=UPI003A7FA29D